MKDHIERRISVCNKRFRLHESFDFVGESAYTHTHPKSHITRTQTQKLTTKYTQINCKH